MNYADRPTRPVHRGGFRRIRGHAIKLIVAGGILGLTLGVVVGGGLGYKVGVYATWRLVTHRLKGAQ